MKRILLFILLCSYFTTHAQDNASSKFYIGINFSPDYAYRNLNVHSNSPSHIVKEVRDANENGKFGFTTGFNAGLKISDNLEFETGIQFSNKGYETEKKSLFYAPPPTNADPVRAGFTYNYRYIGIPLRVKFYMGNGKARLVSSAGFTTSFLLRASQEVALEYADGRTEKKRQTSPENFKKIDFSPMLSLGLDYQISNNIYIAAEPTFRYGLIKTIDAPVTEHLWSAGLNLSLYQHGFYGKYKNLFRKSSNKKG